VEQRGNEARGERREGGGGGGWGKLPPEGGEGGIDTCKY